MALTRETVIGLDLGVDQVSIAQVSVHGKGRPHLVNAGQAHVTPGLGVEGVAEVIRELWKTSRLSTFTVATCLRSASLMVRHFRFPSLNDDELTAALLLEAEEVLQLEADQIVMDWHENGPKVSPSDTRGREGVLVAVPRVELDHHLAILEAAGLFPIVVDAGCTAVSNTFMALRGEECVQHPVCLVNMAGHTVDTAILYDGRAMYPRCIADVGEGDQRDRRLSGSLTDVLKYYEFKLRQEAVTDLVITGRAPGMEALCRAVQTRVGLPVSLWDPCRDMVVTGTRIKQMLSERSEIGRGLTAAIGMAMRR